MRRLPALVVVVSVALAPGCSCNKSSALTEKAPEDLPAVGLVIDQPAEGAALTGAWTTVAGWASPDWVKAVFVTGAPADGFYLPAGHVGVPTVPVTFRSDGRFFAARVPLTDGEVKLTLVPVGKGGSFYQSVTRTVTASGTSVTPATLVVDPAQPEPGQKATLRATTGDDLSTPFQWDFDGDGTFDAEGPSVTHTWATAGRYEVVARTKVKDAWVSAFARVVVDSAPKVLASVPVDNPSRLFFLTIDHYAKVALGDDDYARADERPSYGNERPTVALADGGTVPRDLLAVVDGDTVRVFGPDLSPRFTLSGLSAPSGVARDETGGLLVADTGNDRLVRFTATGALDPSFAPSAEYRGTAELPMRRPVSLTFGGGSVLLESGAILRCGTNSSGAFSCSKGWDFKDALVRLELPRIDRFIMSARADAEDEPDLFLASGQVVGRDVSGSGLEGVERSGMVADAVRSPDSVQSSYAYVDDRGRLYLRRWPWTDGPYTFPYRATAVATDRLGHIYVAGPGVVELRDFEALK